MTPPTAMPTMVPDETGMPWSSSPGPCVTPVVPGPAPVAVAEAVVVEGSSVRVAVSDEGAGVGEGASENTRVCLVTVTTEWFGMVWVMPESVFLEVV